MRVRYTHTIHTFRKMTLIDFYVNPAKSGIFTLAGTEILSSPIDLYGQKLFTKVICTLAILDVNGLVFFPFDKCNVQSQPIFKCRFNHTKNVSYYNQIRCFIYMPKNEMREKLCVCVYVCEEKKRVSVLSARTRDTVQQIGICCAFHTFIPSIVTNSHVGYFVEH